MTPNEYIAAAFAAFAMIHPFELPLDEATTQHEQIGVASIYYRGRRTACRQRFNPKAFTAAHRTLPCGTKITVVNLSNEKEVTVTINDRGPFNSRIIDLTPVAAEAIGLTRRKGTQKVKLLWQTMNPEKERRR